MRALTIRRDVYGPPSESIRLETVPAPRLHPSEASCVLAAVLATGPNFNTNFAALGLPVPVFGKGDIQDLHIPGSDALAIVVDAGPAVTRVKIGQAVVLDSWTGRNIRGYETHDGFNAQFVVADEERALPLPETLKRRSPESLAAMLLTFGTAYRAIVERMRVSPGESVLVMGGGKGTSFAGAQIAKALGARVVLVGSNPLLGESMIARGVADAFIDRRALPGRIFGPIPPGMSFDEWKERTEAFRRAVREANGGRPVDKVFEHTGGSNFPLLVSAIDDGGTLSFFGATGSGLRGEYKLTFFRAGRRHTMDARWVWMRQKQVLFRRGSPESVFSEIGLPPGRRGLVWGADAYGRKFARAALARGSEVAVIASRSKEERGIALLRRMGIPQDHIVDLDTLTLPEEMPDPLTADGRPNPEYASGYMKHAQALGKALWGVFGRRASPDFVVDRPDRNMLHFSTFVARDFDERDAMPNGFVLIGGDGGDLTLSGSHMYDSAQAREVLRLLGSGRIAMEQEDVEIAALENLPRLQQAMLEGTMKKAKGVALVQADRPGRPVAEYEDVFMGERLAAADPSRGRFLDLRLAGDTAVLTLSRPDALNALCEELLGQLDAVVREIRDLGTVQGRPVRGLVLTGAGRAFVAGADVKEFLGRSADDIARLAASTIRIFGDLERLPVPVIAVVDGFALGGGNELAMSAHYRIVTENAVMGQPEVKLGIMPGYGGMQRLPRLVGPERAAAMCVNGDPVDGRTAVAIGLADEFRTSASALSRAVRLAAEIRDGGIPLPRKDWDALGGPQRKALAALLDRPEIRGILSAEPPDASRAKDVRAARTAAGRAALDAMVFGLENGFAAGLANDARAFGVATASAAGQEWVRRFLEKDPLQAKSISLLPSVSGRRSSEPEPISKKAPGDRPISSEEVGRIASLITEKEAEGKVSPLPPETIHELAALLKGRGEPELLSFIGAAEGGPANGRIAFVLESGEVPVFVVDLGDRTGFPRENARPVCEVLLVRRGEELRWLGKKRLLSSEGAVPAIFLAKGFVEKARARPHLLLQSILHPLFEWLFDLPHIVAVLCESAYNADPSGAGGTDLSDLNRFLGEEAGRDRDFAYFDRILGTPYEPDEFRMEELRARFGSDESRIADVVSRARALASRFGKHIENVKAEAREAIVRESIASGRQALDEGDAPRALEVLRRLSLDPETPGILRSEIDAVIGLAVRSCALNADPGYEGLRLENGAVAPEPWAGRKALEFRTLLESAAEIVKRWLPETDADGGTDPLGERGAPRSIHVVADLERPSGKFIDGHDRVHWEFEKPYVEALLSGFSPGAGNAGIPALLACRFVRDGAFPDEKLKLDRQFAVAAKGAIEGYRFFQALPSETRARMAEFVESGGICDPLHKLFASLGEETHPARASHLIRRAVSRTHSYNQVRYPDTALAGQVVVITGGGTGMGRALALEAVRRSANVVVIGRRPAPLEETRADMDDIIRFLGLTNQTATVQGDVGDPKYVGEMFDRIEREFGRIDVLYNNAGVSGPVEFGSAYREEHLDLYRDAVNIHLTGAWLASLEASRIMESQPLGGTIVMVGTYYCESVHRHVLHAYPGRLPYTSAQSSKLALGDYLAWALADRNITVVSVNPAAVSTDRIRRGSGVFDKGATARARIGRRVSPEALERDTLDRTVGHEFLRPRDFAQSALDIHRLSFRRAIGGQRLPMGGVTYEQPPGIVPSPAALERFPDLVGKVALVAVVNLASNDVPLLEATATALVRSGASVVLSGRPEEELDRLALKLNAMGGEGMGTVSPGDLGSPSAVQELFDRLPRIDLLAVFTGSVDWKRPLTHLPFEDWTSCVDRFGFVPRLLCWQAERRMDREKIDGTIVIVGPDLSGVPSIRERNLVQVFQAMLRPAVATESMERALMRKAQSEGTAPAYVSDLNIGLVLPGRTDGRNRSADAGKTAATVLWLVEEGKSVSGAVLLPDEQNSVARLPPEPRALPGSMSGKVAVVTGGIRNLGREISLRFAGEKATVVVASRRPRAAGVSPEESLKATADLAAADSVLSAMRKCGGRSLWIDADISSPRKVRALIEETRNRFGRIDAFVNNAGAGGDFSLFPDVLREHRASWEAVLRCNFLGPWTSIACLADLMKSQTDGGVVVNVSTHYADHPYLFRTIYTVSKILLKGLTLALSARLARDNVRLVDIAPSLIAGPRMNWVMGNYAAKFAEQISAVRDLRAAEGTALKGVFVRCFDRSSSVADRSRAEREFLAAVRGLRLPKSRREELATWFDRIREWFRATVPDAPPTNENVADAVLFAAKNAAFLEDPFIGVTSLPSFSSFPGTVPDRKEALSGRSAILLSIGEADGEPWGLPEAMRQAGVALTSVRESMPRDGKAEIQRPAAAGSGGRKIPEKISRDLDLSDPKVLEPWLDNSLLGGPPHAGAVVRIGTSVKGKTILKYSLEETDGFLAHVTRIQNALAESIRAVGAWGNVVVVVPGPDSEEAHLVRLAARQMVRTAQAERHFLPAGGKPPVSLITEPRKDEEASFRRRILDILSGESPPAVEPVAAGHPRP
jgi:enoyl-CoA hydratase